MVKGRIDASHSGLRVLAAAAVAAGAAGGAVLAGAPPVAAASSASATLQKTLGGPGHATMYDSGMEVAPDGTVVVADTGNDQIAKFSASGTQLWRVGGNGGGTLKFQQPRDVAVDQAGNIYVADDANARVAVLNANGGWMGSFKGPTGDTVGNPIGISSSNGLVFVADPTHNRVHVFNTVGHGTLGSQVRSFGSNGACQLNRFRDVDADAAGNIYVANYVSNNILKFSPTGTCITTWGTKGSGNGQFMNPYGVRIATDPVLGGQHVYVADSNNDRIQEFSLTGAFNAAVGSAGTPTTPGTFTQLRRVAVDAAGNVWGADLWGYRAVRFDRTSTGYAYHGVMLGGQVPPLTLTHVFNEVRGLDFYNGNVYAMDTVNQRVVIFGTNGSVTACGQRGFTEAGDFNWPRGVAVDDSTGNIWVADTKQSDIQVLSPSCAGLAKFGTVGSGTGQLNWPYSIAIRQSDHIAFLADTKNNRVVSYGVSSHAQIGSYGGTGLLNQPSGIAVVPNSNLILVADTLDNRVVELSDNHGTGFHVVRTFTAGFSQPRGVAGDGAGHIAVADSNHSRVVLLDGTTGAQLGVITGGFNHPENVAFDPTGKLYVADTYNDRILVYSVTWNTGIVRAGSNATTPAVLGAPTYSRTLMGPGLPPMYPVDITFSWVTNAYYVMDGGRYRVLEVQGPSPGTVVAQVGGVQGNGPGQFGDARAIDVDPSGNVYVADTPNNRIEKFTSGLQYLSQWGSRGNGNGQFQLVYGLAIGPGIGAGGAAAQVLYATDGAGRVEKFDLNGTFLGNFVAPGVLNQPRQVTVNPANGDVYVVDARNHRVVVYTQNGAQKATFGSAGTGPGQFSGDARGIAITPDGAYVMVTDSGGARVEVWQITSSPAYQYLYQIGSSGTAANQFVGPRGIVITSGATSAHPGYVMVTDEWGFGLKQWSFTAAGGTFAGSYYGCGTSNPCPPYGVSAPRGLDIDPGTGRIVIDDYWNQRVETVNPDGSAPQVFGFRGTKNTAGALNFAWGVAVQPGSGNIFVANRESHDIVVFNRSGAFQTFFGSRGTANGQFTFPQGLAFDPSTGNLLVADSGNNRIDRFSVPAGCSGSGCNGTFLASYGSKGSSGAGQLSMPTGVAVAPDGTIWVADTLNNAIQRRATNGTWTKLTFTRPTGALRVPWGVEVAPDGSIWVADTGNNRILSLTSTGAVNWVATAASMGIPGGLNGPFGIVFGAGKHVYLSDTWNDRVLDLVTP